MRKQIAYRPDAATYEQLRLLAERERRSVANMVEVLVRIGLSVFEQAKLGGVGRREGE